MKKTLMLLAASAAIAMLALPAYAGGGSKGGNMGGGNKGGSMPHSYHSMGGNKGGTMGGSMPHSFHISNSNHNTNNNNNSNKQSQNQSQSQSANSKSSSSSTAYGGTVSGSGNSTNSGNGYGGSASAALTNVGNPSVSVETSSGGDLSGVMSMAPLLLLAVMPGLNYQPPPPPACPAYMMPMPDGGCQPPVILHSRG